jgi:hypothetical protein
MRRTWILLAPLLLAGCIKDSASYYIDGGNEHTLTVRAEQEYFWKDEVTLTLVTARLPDCQRQIALTTLPSSGMDVELFSVGDNVYSLRSGTELWQVETGNCTRLPEPAPNALGEPVGVFKMDGEKMVFEKAAPAAQ